MIKRDSELGHVAKGEIDSKDVHRDFLLKSHTEFKDELYKRLEIGLKLIERKISTVNELKKAISDFRSWNDYNSELLQQSFEKPNNKYYKEYNHSRISIIGLGGSSPSFHESLKNHKYDLEEKQKRLQLIFGKVELIPLLKIEPIPNNEENDSEVLNKLDNLFSKFHRIALPLQERRKDKPCFLIEDEYDVQDLLGAMLRLYFIDIRPEDFVPNSSGSNSRIDFILKKEQIGIEVKMANKNLRDKQLGEELLIDIGRYKEHPDCKKLIIFIYDKNDFIKNKAALIHDIDSKSTTDFPIHTFICPF